MRRSKPELAVQEGLGRFDRAPVGIAPIIERDGGMYGAGVMRGVSIATRGEALGHGYWLDGTTLEQIHQMARGLQAKGPGLKARFTHPGMSSDGMGKALGRIVNPSRQGDRVYGDLHFYESAKQTPDGDLADYVMSLAEEDPQAAGLSIVFLHDFEAEEAFEAQFSVDGEFVSPDPENEKSYPHVRLRELRAADVVDEPAANPNGLFDSAPLARQVDELLAYAAGLSERRPADPVLGVDPDRAAQFFRRWAAARGLSIGTQEDPPAAGDQMSDTATEVSTGQGQSTDTPQMTADQFRAELRRFTDRFGAANAAEFLAAGKTYEESLESYCEQLQAERDAAIAAREEAESRLASLSLGDTPIETGTTNGPAKKKTFAEHVKRK